MDKRILTFYAEWLSLPKEQFRVLVMLADIEPFRGNLSDMCRYFFVDPQTRHRNRLKNAIELLVREGYVAANNTGRTYQMTTIPKATEILIPNEWVARLRQREYHSETVAWEVVLKVHLWLTRYSRNQTITNAQIAADIGVSDSTVVAAKNVLEKEYKAFIKHYEYDVTAPDFYMRKGQIIDMSAWWAKD